MATSHISQYIVAHKLRVIALSALLVSLFSATFIAIYFGYIEEERRQNLTQIESQLGSLLEQRVSLRIDELVSPVQRLAERPRVKNLITLGEQQRATWQTNQIQTYPSLLDIKLVDHKTPLSRGILGGLSYTDIDLINRARETNTAQLEALRVSDQWVIRYLHPIIDDQGNQGLLMASLSPAYLSAALSALPASIPSAAIMQAFGQERPVPFVNKASYEPGHHSIQLRNYSWQLRYTTNATLLIPAAPKLTLMWLLLALCIGTSGTLLWMFWPLAVGSFTHQKPLKDVPEAAEQSLQDVHDAPSSMAEIAALTAGQKSAVEQTDDEPDIDDIFELDDSLANDNDQLGSSNAADTGLVDEYDLDNSIFRDYDIRGVADTQLSDESCLLIGQAIGTHIQDIGGSELYVGSDDRLSSPRIKRWVSEGILLSGCNLIDIGSVHSGQLYFAASTGQTPHGIMITASHNPAEYNGIKVVVDGRARGGDTIQALLALCHSNQLKTGKGTATNDDFNQRYVDHIAADVAILDPLKVVVDCANAVAGRIAQQLFESVGCDVVTINCDIDGSFPNHDPNPSVPANLAQLRERVVAENADLGIALDGDADRVVAVTTQGDIVEPDQLIALLSIDLLSRQPNATIVFDVKCSQLLPQTIKAHGGLPMMTKSGHSNVKDCMADTGAALGGEYSGHIFFKERWFGFDDGLYAAARLIEFISLDGRSLAELVTELPTPHASPEFRVDVGEHNKDELMRRIIKALKALDGDRELIDGLIIRQRHAWGLVRPSNTENALTFRFEGNDAARLETFTDKYRLALNEAELEVELPF